MYQGAKGRPTAIENLPSHRENFWVRAFQNHRKYDFCYFLDLSGVIDENKENCRTGGIDLVLLTGDIHGEVSRIRNIVERLQLTAGDTIVILGDVGMNYYGNNKGDRHRKKRLDRCGVPILCVHGNHEMRPETIDTYKEIQWNSGIVYVEEDYPNLLFAKDGEVYDLDGQKSLVIGGAYSVDKWYRLQCDLKWFPDEQPSQEIKERVEGKLNDLGWKVDSVLSHTCPARYIPTEAFLTTVNQATVDRSTEDWLDSIAAHLDYGRWYCGHWHIDKHLEDFSFLFESYEIFPAKEE